MIQMPFNYFKHKNELRGGWVGVEVDSGGEMEEISLDNGAK